MWGSLSGMASSAASALFTGLTKVLALQSAIVPTGTDSPYRNQAAEGNALVNYNFSGLSEPLPTAAPALPALGPITSVTQRGYLRGPYQEPLTDIGVYDSPLSSAETVSAIEQSAIDLHSTEAAQNITAADQPVIDLHSTGTVIEGLATEEAPEASKAAGPRALTTTLTCVAGSITRTFYFPNNGAYNQDQAFTITATANDGATTFTFISMSPGTMKSGSSSGSTVSVSAPGWNSQATVTYTPASHSYGTVIVDIIADYNDGTQCSTSGFITYTCNNQFDQLAFPINSSALQGNVGSPLYWAFPPVTNYDDCSLTYGLQAISGPGINSTRLPSWVTFTGSPSAIFTVPALGQGTYIWKANVTGSSPPKPPSGTYAYYAETYLTLIIPDQAPSTKGTISCPAGRVGDTIVCSVDLTQIFTDGDGWADFKSFTLQNAPGMSLSVNGTTATITFPITKSSVGAGKLVATDSQGVQTSADFSIAFTGSLSANAAPSLFSVNESTPLAPTVIELPKYNVSSLAGTTRVVETITGFSGAYSIVNGTNVTVQYGTGQLVTSGLLNDWNAARRFFKLGDYQSGFGSYSVTITDPTANYTSGLNNPITYSADLSVAEVLVPLSFNGNMTGISLKPQDTGSMSIVAPYNPNNYKTQYAGINIYGPSGNIVATDSSPNGWTIVTSSSQISFTPPTGVIGVHTAELKTQRIDRQNVPDSNNIVSSYGPINVEGTLSATLQSPLISFPQNTGAANATRFYLYNVGQRGSQNVSVRITGSGDEASFVAEPYQGVIPTVSNANKIASWQVNAPLDVVKWYGQNFLSLPAPLFYGPGNPWTIEISNDVDPAQNLFQSFTVAKGYFPPIAQDPIAIPALSSCQNNTITYPSSSFSQVQGSSLSWVWNTTLSDGSSFCGAVDPVSGAALFTICELKPQGFTVFPACEITASQSFPITVGITDSSSSLSLSKLQAFQQPTLSISPSYQAPSTRGIVTVPPVSSCNSVRWPFDLASWFNSNGYQISVNVTAPDGSSFSAAQDANGQPIFTGYRQDATGITANVSCLLLGSSSLSGTMKVTVLEPKYSGIALDKRQVSQDFTMAVSSSYQTPSTKGLITTPSALSCGSYQWAFDLASWFATNGYPVSVNVTARDGSSFNAAKDASGQPIFTGYSQDATGITANVSCLLLGSSSLSGTMKVTVVEPKYLGVPLDKRQISQDFTMAVSSSYQAPSTRSAVTVPSVSSCNSVRWPFDLASWFNTNGYQISVNVTAPDGSSFSTAKDASGQPIFTGYSQDATGITANVSCLLLGTNSLPGTMKVTVLEPKYEGIALGKRQVSQDFTMAVSSSYQAPSTRSTVTVPSVSSCGMTRWLFDLASWFNTYGPIRVNVTAPDGSAFNTTLVNGQPLFTGYSQDGTGITMDLSCLLLDPVTLPGTITVRSADPRYAGLPDAALEASQSFSLTINPSYQAPSTRGIVTVPSVSSCNSVRWLFDLASWFNSNGYQVSVNVTAPDGSSFSAAKDASGQPIFTGYSQDATGITANVSCLLLGSSSLSGTMKVTVIEPKYLGVPLDKRQISQDFTMAVSSSYQAPSTRSAVTVPSVSSCNGLRWPFDLASWFNTNGYQISVNVTAPDGSSFSTAKDASGQPIFTGYSQDATGITANVSCLLLGTNSLPGTMKVTVLEPKYEGIALGKRQVSQDFTMAVSSSYQAPSTRSAVTVPSVSSCNGLRWPFDLASWFNTNGYQISVNVTAPDGSSFSAAQDANGQPIFTGYSQDATGITANVSCSLLNSVSLPGTMKVTVIEPKYSGIPPANRQVSQDFTMAVSSSYQAPSTRSTVTVPSVSSCGTTRWLFDLASWFNSNGYQVNVNVTAHDGSPFSTAKDASGQPIFTGYSQDNAGITANVSCLLLGTNNLPGTIKLTVVEPKYSGISAASRQVSQDFTMAVSSSYQAPSTKGLITAASALSCSSYQWQFDLASWFASNGYPVSINVTARDGSPFSAAQDSNGQPIFTGYRQDATGITANVSCLLLGTNNLPGTMTATVVEPKYLGLPLAKRQVSQDFTMAVSSSYQAPTPKGLATAPATSSCMTTRWVFDLASWFNTYGPITVNVTALDGSAFNAAQDSSGQPVFTSYSQDDTGITMDLSCLLLNPVALPGTITVRSADPRYAGLPDTVLKASQSFTMTVNPSYQKPTNKGLVTAPTASSCGTTRWVFDLASWFNTNGYPVRVNVTALDGSPFNATLADGQPVFTSYNQDENGVTASFSCLLLNTATLPGKLNIRVIDPRYVGLPDAALEASQRFTMTVNPSYQPPSAKGLINGPTVSSCRTIRWPFDLASWFNTYGPITVSITASDGNAFSSAQDSRGQPVFTSYSQDGTGINMDLSCLLLEPVTLPGTMTVRSADPRYAGLPDAVLKASQNFTVTVNPSYQQPTNKGLIIAPKITSCSEFIWPFDLATWFNTYGPINVTLTAPDGSTFNAAKDSTGKPLFIDYRQDATGVSANVSCLLLDPVNLAGKLTVRSTDARYSALPDSMLEASQIFTIPVTPSYQRPTNKGLMSAPIASSCNTLSWQFDLATWFNFYGSITVNVTAADGSSFNAARDISDEPIFTGYRQDTTGITANVSCSLLGTSNLPGRLTIKMNDPRYADLPSLALQANQTFTMTVASSYRSPANAALIPAQTGSPCQVWTMRFDPSWFSVNNPSSLQWSVSHAGRPFCDLRNAGQPVFSSCIQQADGIYGNVSCGTGTFDTSGEVTVIDTDSRFAGIALASRQASQTFSFSVTPLTTPTPPDSANANTGVDYQNLLPKVLSSVGGTAAGLIAIWGIMKATHNMQIAARRKKMFGDKSAALKEALEAMHKKHPLLYPELKAMRQLYMDVLAIDPLVFSEEDRKKLRAFRVQSFAYAVAQETKASQPTVDWGYPAPPIWDQIEDHCKRLKRYMESRDADLKVVEARLQIIRALLDLLVLTITLRNKPEGISKKLDVLDALNDLIKTWEKRQSQSPVVVAHKFQFNNPLSAKPMAPTAKTDNIVVAVETGDKEVLSPEERISAELHGAKAALTCVIDKAKICGNIRRKRAAEPPQPEYFDLKLFECLIAYALAESKPEFTGEKTALTELLKVYKALKGEQFRYAKGLLHKILPANNRTGNAATSDQYLADVTDQDRVNHELGGATRAANRLRAVAAASKQPEQVPGSVKATGHAMFRNVMAAAGAPATPARAPGLHSLVLAARAAQQQNAGSPVLVTPVRTVAGAENGSDSDPHASSSRSSSGQSSPDRLLLAAEVTVVDVVSPLHTAAKAAANRQSFGPQAVQRTLSVRGVVTPV